MQPRTRGHLRDTAHHHPRVHQPTRGTWGWECACGGASCRSDLTPLTWRQALISALNHAVALAP